MVLGRNRVWTRPSDGAFSARSRHRCHLTQRSTASPPGGGLEQVRKVSAGRLTVSARRSAHSRKEAGKRHDAAQEHLLAYFQRALQERRHHRRDDLLSALLAAEEDGDRLTEEELLG